MPKISILGCGWLGLPLAKILLEQSFGVAGSTTSKAKIPLLESFGILPFLISLSANGVQGDLIGFLQNSEILIIDIPPKLRGIDSENFVAKIANLIPAIERAGIKKVLFVSSTAVYADDNSVVTETTLPKPDSEGGRQLLEAEHLLLNADFQTAIVRFGGLTGQDRHPVKFLAGRENLENPDGPVNLIHQNDCIGIILKIIQKEVWGEAFNAAFPNHPSRENYYTDKAMSLDLALPKFNREKPSVGKTIDSEKLIRMLDYTFTTPI